MNTYKEQTIIRTVCADINGDGYNEKIVLAGMPLESDDNYMETIALNVEFEDGRKKEYNLQERGTDFSIFAVDVTNSKSDEILLIGNYNKYGTFSTIKIYKYENDDLVVLFDNKTYGQKINYKTKYLDGYKIEIICEKTGQQYIIDINNANKDCLINNYGEHGNVTNNINNINYNIENVFPIKLPNNDYYSLLIQQGFRVDENMEKLGGIQTLANISENGEITIVDQYLMTKAY